MSATERFLLILMFLDYAVKPFYYERGEDFYKDGQNYALASLLYTMASPCSARRNSMICSRPSNWQSR